MLSRSPLPPPRNRDLFQSQASKATSLNDDGLLARWSAFKEVFLVMFFDSK
jgi:hypothetical protein